MNINLGAWRRDEKVIGWLVQKSREFLDDPEVIRALDAVQFTDNSNSIYNLGEMQYFNFRF